MATKTRCVWRWRRDRRWPFPRWKCNGWKVWEHNGRWYILGKLGVLRTPAGNYVRRCSRQSAQLAAERAARKACW